MGISKNSPGLAGYLNTEQTSQPAGLNGIDTRQHRYSGII